MFKPAQVPIGKLGQYGSSFSYGNETTRMTVHLNSIEAPSDTFCSVADSEFAESGTRA